MPRIRGKLTVPAALIMQGLMVAVILCGAPPLKAAGGDSLMISLDRAVRLGLENDEILRQATEAVAGARGEVQAAKAAALPQLSISAQYGRNFKKPAFFLPEEFREDPNAPAKVEIGEDNEFYGTATVTQILWAAGRVRAGLSAAEQYLESSRFQEIAAADYVRFSVQDAYYAVLLAEEMLQISAKALHDAEEAVRVAKTGFEQGTVSKFDVMRAEVELANRRTPLVAAENDLVRALARLRRRCGIASHVRLTLTDSLTAAQLPGDLDELIAAMRAHSPELKALEHYVSANQYFVRLTRAERYPTLQLSANYAIQSQWSKGFTPDKDLIAHVSGVQLGLYIPIFDGFRTKGNRWIQNEGQDDERKGGSARRGARVRENDARQGARRQTIISDARKRHYRPRGEAGSCRPRRGGAPPRRRASRKRHRDAPRTARRGACDDHRERPIRRGALRVRHGAGLPRTCDG
jgi:outer membrane protein TolC